MNINFHPDFNKTEFEDATREYQDIWKNYGGVIIQSLEKYTDLTFKENLINAVIHEGISTSNPLSLRASYSMDVKKATLIHELGHRLLFGNNIKAKSGEEKSLSVHKQLYLFLYEVWENLFGKEFADKQVEVESARFSIYKEAWDWALLMDVSKRKEELDKLIILGIKKGREV